MNHLSEEDLILFYYSEPGLAASARGHLRECAECRAASDSLVRTLDLCNSWSVPEPPPAFERTVWAQLAPQIENRQARWFAFPRTWIAVAAAAMLLMGAFFMGRMSRTPQPSIVAGLSNQARERILEISLADHLDRAGMLLTEISNTDESGLADFASERDRAHDLVEEGRLLHQTFARRGTSATLTFLDDLERILTEVSHAPDAREIQQRISSGSLLFKVRIIESNLRTQGQKS
ncbi:MAG: hypothetical protein M3N54_00245 [Acidobacteriota bacterium]|nr:hypothetical protein [Acidobacteriota bacterium]